MEFRNNITIYKSVTCFAWTNYDTFIYKTLQFVEDVLNVVYSLWHWRKENLTVRRLNIVQGQQNHFLLMASHEDSSVNNRKAELWRSFDHWLYRFCSTQRTHNQWSCWHRNNLAVTTRTIYTFPMTDWRIMIVWLRFKIVVIEWIYCSNLDIRISRIFVHVHHACFYFYVCISSSTIVCVWVAIINSYSTANVIDFTHSQTVGLGVSHAKFSVHYYLLFRPTALEHWYFGIHRFKRLCVIC